MKACRLVYFGHQKLILLPCSLVFICLLQCRHSSLGYAARDVLITKTQNSCRVVTKFTTAEVDEVNKNFG